MRHSVLGLLFFLSVTTAYAGPGSEFRSPTYPNIKINIGDGFSVRLFDNQSGKTLGCADLMPDDLHFCDFRDEVWARDVSWHTVGKTDYAFVWLEKDVYSSHNFVSVQFSVIKISGDSLSKIQIFKGNSALEDRFSPKLVWGKNERGIAKTAAGQGLMTLKIHPDGRLEANLDDYSWWWKMIARTLFDHSFTPSRIGLEFDRNEEVVWKAENYQNWQQGPHKQVDFDYCFWGDIIYEPVDWMPWRIDFDNRKSCDTL